MRPAVTQSWGKRHKNGSMAFWSNMSDLLPYRFRTDMEFDLAEVHATEQDDPADQHETNEEPDFVELDMGAGRSQVLNLIEQQVLELLEELANNRVPALHIVSHQ